MEIRTSRGAHHAARRRCGMDYLALLTLDLALLLALILARR